MFCTRKDNKKKNNSPVPNPSYIDKYDRNTAVFSTACFATVLSWAAVSNFKYSFCYQQWFMTIGALVATLTDLACLAVFIWNVYKLLKLPDNKEKPFNKTVIRLELLGSLIATVGTFFFAAHVDQKLNLLSAIPLPPEWVAPMMFLFALVLFSLASLLNFKEKKKDKATTTLLQASEQTDASLSTDNNEDIDKTDNNINVGNQCSNFNCVNFFSFIVQIPGIGFLLYQSAAGNIPPHAGFHANNILITALFIGAIGALSLFLDGLGLRKKITDAVSDFVSSSCNYTSSLTK